MCKLLIFSAAFFAALPLYADVVTEMAIRVRQQSVDSQSSKTAEAALRSLDAKTGKGWAVVDTTGFFPAGLMKRFYASVAEPAAVADASSDGDAKTLTPDQMAPLQDYVAWLKAMINRSLGPKEQVEIAYTEVHVMKSGQRSKEHGPWHVDQDYLSAAVTLVGEGTQYFATGPQLTPDNFTSYEVAADKRKDARTVSRARTFIWSGADRAEAFPNVHAQIHRIPPTQDRVFLVVRFAPKK